MFHRIMYESCQWEDVFQFVKRINRNLSGLYLGNKQGRQVFIRRGQVVEMTGVDWGQARVKWPGLES